ncbi:MAG: MFS transporter [Caldilineaceae bacterium]|nr:MFS transporter [Caldilineaceae bacterium]MBP8109093.1 MFS transporter [Caldilineaceae bacterium]MBP8124169.1 MFS transporter [Caldilineaceae bacterium]MBP9073325.1 MFS transporter [Caldilineaceae bacterium]
MSQNPIAPAVTPAVRRRINGTLFTAQSLFGAATIATFPVLTILSANMAGDAAAGVPQTVSMIGRAAVAYPIGLLMDRFGRRMGFSLGFMLAVYGLVLCAAAVRWDSFVVLCLGAGLLGMGRAASEQIRFAAAEVVTASRRAKAIGLIVFAGTVGAVGGPLLTAPSEEWAARFGLDAQMGSFLAAALLTAIALVIIFAFLRPDPLRLGLALAAEESAAEAHPVPLAPARPVREILGGSRVRLAIGAMVIGQMVMTLLMVITPLHMSQHAYDTQAISWVIMAHTLGMFGLSSLTGRMIDRLGPVPTIGLGAGILIVSGLMIPLGTGFWLLVSSLFLLGLGWNLCFIAGSSLLSDALAANERGRVQGTNEMLVALASGAGSLGTGTAFAFGGIIGVSAIGLAATLVLVTGVVWVQGRTPLPAVGD